MRETLLLLVILATVQAHASTVRGKSGKRLDLAPPGQKAETTEDPGSATPLLFQDHRKQPSSNPFGEAGEKGKVTVSATCTDSLGMVHKQADPGYQGCARQQNRARPTDAPGDRRSTNSFGISIGK